MGSRHTKKTSSFRGIGYVVVFVVFVALAAGLITLLDSFSGNPHTASSSSQPSSIASDSTDSNSNVSSSEAPEVTDIVPPEISGTKDKTVYIGETVSYRSGVTVTDDQDPSPSLTVDSSNVDLTKEGSYQVTYTATDNKGNKTETTITVTVKKKVESSVSTDDVYALADKKLNTLLKDGMTTREKVKAIYNWANTSIWYSGKSNKEDYLSEAQKVLKGGGTDCFGYFAVTKLMFERLGIPNIDVVKVKNYDGDSSHFWSLVSIDGGNTYYHFDATPRKGDGDYFFLVTDAELDEYSNAHNKCHNRDKSLYPATPEE